MLLLYYQVNRQNAIRISDSWKCLGQLVNRCPDSTTLPGPLLNPALLYVYFQRFTIPVPQSTKKTDVVLFYNNNKVDVLDNDVTKGLSQGEQNLAEGTNWPP